MPPVSRTGWARLAAPGAPTKKSSRKIRALRTRTTGTRFAAAIRVINGGDMNVGSASAASLWGATKSPAAPTSGTDQALTFRGRPIIGYGRDGLPVLGETAEE